MLAGLQGCERERIVRRNGRGNGDGVELGIGDQVVVRARAAHSWVAPDERVEPGLVEVADPTQVGLFELVQVANEVRAPVAEADDADTDRLVREA